MADSTPGVRQVQRAGMGPEREVWLGVHADLRHMPRIRAVIDAIDAVFEQSRSRFAGG